MAARDSPFGSPTLHDLTSALAGAGTIDDVAAVLLDLGAAIVGADSAHLSVVVQPGWRRDFSAAGVAGSGRSAPPIDRPISLDTPLSRALGAGQEQVFESRAAYRTAFPHLGADLERVTTLAAVTIPMRRSDGQVIAALTYGFAAAGPPPAARRQLATGVAEQGSLALDRALLLHREHQAAQRAVRLQDVTARLAAAERRIDVADALATAGRNTLGSQRCGLYVTVGDESLVLCRPSTSAPHVDLAATLPSMISLDARSPVSEAVLRRDIVHIDNVAQYAARYGRETTPTFGAALVVPLIIADRVVGVLFAVFDGPRTFTADDRALANRLAEQVALAVDRSTLREHAARQAVIVARERDRLAAVTSSLQDGLYITDLHGCLLEVNDRFCDLAGYPREQIIGTRPPYPWWPTGDVAASQRFLDALGDRVRTHGRNADERGDAPGEFDVTFVRPDGRHMLGLLTAAALHGPDGEIVGAVGTVKDVTIRVLAERRLRALQAVTEAMAPARSVGDVVRATIDAAVSALRAESGAFYSRHDDGQLVCRYSSDAQRTLFTVDEHLVNDAMTNARTNVGAMGSIGGRTVQIPVVVGNEASECISLTFRDERSVLPEAMPAFTAIGQQCGQAIERALSTRAEHRALLAAERSAERMRQVARTLQQSLLPRLVDVSDRCSVAARYHPAVDELQVGGDWYDAVTISPELLAITVGDVVGRGVSAAAAMGQLRSALGALAVGGGPPHEVLERLDRYARRIDGAEAATVAYALLDTNTGTLRYSCAGHLPPLLIDPGSPPQFLEGGRGWPLGIRRELSVRTDATARLRPGSVVVLYTDGLVERRGTDLDERLALLRATAGRTSVRDPEELCDRLLEALVDGEPQDDVAMLVVVFDPALADHVRWAFPPQPASLHEATGVVRRWLHRRGIVDPVAHQLVEACDVICADAIDIDRIGPEMSSDVVLDVRCDDQMGVIIEVDGRRAE